MSYITCKSCGEIVRLTVGEHKCTDPYGLKNVRPEDYGWVLLADRQSVDYDLKELSLKHSIQLGYGYYPNHEKLPESHPLVQRYLYLIKK